jgi:O-antigen/teichoic acid export membrane protein
MEQPHSSNTLFRPAAADVERLARRGAAWNITLLAARYLVSLGSTAALSRLLSPSDYGLLGMALTLTALFQAISDLGLSWATIHSDEVSKADVDTLFWVNAAIGVVLCIATVLAAPVLAGFYHRQELGGVATFLGGGFIFAAASGQPLALLRRRMQYRQISWAGFLSQTLGGLGGILCALAHWGYWALVAQVIIAQVSNLLLLAVFSSYLPGLPHFTRATGRLLKFGGTVAVSGMIGYVSRNADSVFVGHRWGADALGYYNRAYFLISLPASIATAALMTVVIPALSALRDDSAAVGRAYRQAVVAVSVIAFPLAIGMGVAAPEFIEVIYGRQWSAVSSLLLWLPIAGMLQPVQGTANWLYISIGRGRMYLVSSFAFCILVTLAFALGNQWGPKGVVITYAVANILLTGPFLGYAHRVAGISLKSTAGALAPVAGCAIGMGAISLLVRNLSASALLPPHTTLLLTIAAGGISYFLLLFLFCGSRTMSLLFNRGNRTALACIPGSAPS